MTRWISCAVLTAALLLTVSASAYAEEPEVSGEFASHVDSTRATLNGTVQTYGVETQYGWVYGVNGTGNATVGVIGAGAENPVDVEKTITGLLPNTTYTYRMGAFSELGAALGPKRSFMTLDWHPTEFTGSEYPVSINGTNDVSVDFEVQGIPFACEAVALSGSLGEGTDALTLAPQFSECNSSVGEATVEPNSCDFVLDVANTGPPYSGSLSVACAKEGDAIEFDVAALEMTMRVGPQTPGGGSLAYENEGKGTATTLSAAGSATEVAWSCSDEVEFWCGYLFGSEEGSSGVLGVDASLKARYGT